MLSEHWLLMRPLKIACKSVEVSSGFRPNSTCLPRRDLVVCHSYYLPVMVGLFSYRMALERFRPCAVMANQPFPVRTTCNIFVVVSACRVFLSISSPSRAIFFGLFGLSGAPESEAPNIFHADRKRLSDDTINGIQQAGNEP